MITVTISLNVTPLTDNTVAFANAAAWNNYFNNLSGEATIDPITVTSYGSGTAYDNTLTYHSLTVDSVNYMFPTKDQFDSLLASYNELWANYSTLRAELYAAGLISAP